MNHIKKNTVCASKSIGDTLRHAREQYGLRLEDIEEVLCIQKKNLEHLEQNAFFNIPETLYRELFLKTYSTYLGLHWDQIRIQYQQECGLTSTMQTSHTETHPRMRIRTSSFWIAPKIVRNTLLTLCIGGGFLYIIFFGYTAFQAPKLVIFHPQTEFSSTGSEQILVAGQTKKEAHLTINGQPVIKKQDGTFSQEVSLNKGLNIITVTVSKKFSRPQSVTRKVLFEQHDEKYSYTQ